MTATVAVLGGVALSETLIVAEPAETSVTVKEPAVLAGATVTMFGAELTAVNVADGLAASVTENVPVALAPPVNAVQ